MKFTVVKLVAALTLGLFTAPLTADAQQAGKGLSIKGSGAPGFMGKTRAIWQSTARWSIST